MDTALHSAAKYGHLEAVKVLIQSGAVVSLNMKNKVRELPWFSTSFDSTLAYLLANAIIFVFGQHLYKTTIRELVKNTIYNDQITYLL